MDELIEREAAKLHRRLGGSPGTFAEIMRIEKLRARSSMQGNQS